MYWLPSRRHLVVAFVFSNVTRSDRIVPKETDISSNQSAFVGREREIAELCTGLEHVRTGRGRFFLVTGEPGIGKTRLADEVTAYAASGGMAVLRAGCWEGAGAPAYWPFIQVLRAALRGSERNALLNLISTQNAFHVTHDLAQLIPELQPPTSAPADSPTQPSPDPEQARFRLFDSVATAFKNLAAVRPLLLILEDLHDADQASLQMLRFVVRDLKNSQAMVLATYRDVEVQRSPVLSQLIGDLTREGAQVPLFALSLDDSGRMIQERSGMPPAPRLVSDIHQATAGNPLFIDGLVRVLAAEGKLRDATRLNLADFRVPDGVREAIRRWLALLSDRSALVIAANIGQQFELRCLQPVTEVPNHQLLDLLREASRVGIVIPVSPGNYRFSHALIRNALSEESDSAQRARLHLKIGAALEKLYQADVGTHLAELAHHFREGGDINKAIAGEVARTVFAYEEAIAHWRTGLELIPEGPEERERRANLLERTAELLGLTGSEGDGQFNYWRQALKHYRELGRLEAAARVEARIAGWLMMRGRGSDMSRALQRDQEAKSISGSDREGQISLVWRHIATASAAGVAGRIEESLAASRRAMELSEQLDDEVLRARAAISHTSSLFASGRLAQSFSLIRWVADEADRLNDTITGTGIVTVCAYALAWLCDPSEAVVRLERELNKPRMADASLMRGVLFDRLRLLALLSGKLREAGGLIIHIQSDPPFEGLIAFYRGEWEQADAVLSRAADEARQEDRRTVAVASRHWLARVRRALGQHSATAAILEQDLAFCIESPQVAFELHSRAALASVYAETQRPEQAHPHLARCREVMAAGEDWRGLAGHITRAEAAVAATEGHFEAANQQFTKAAEIHRRYQVPFEEAETLHYWGRALLAAGDRAAALEKLDSATELYWRHGAGERWLERVENDRSRAESTERQPRIARSPETTPSLEDAGNGKPPGHPELTAVFRKQGEYWTLAWASSESRLKHRKGMHYIAHLLRHPGQELAAADLVSAIAAGSNGSAPAIASQVHQPHATIIRGLGDAGAALDATAKAQYQRRFEDLRDELEQARQLNDPGRADKALGEIEFIESEITAAIDLGRRDRRKASHAERARLAVTKAIKAAINRIRDADPQLARHLSISIQTGYFCAYHPKHPVTWRALARPLHICASPGHTCALNVHARAVSATQ